MVLRTRVIATSIVGVVGLLVALPVARRAMTFHPYPQRGRAAANGAQMILRAAQLHVDLDDLVGCPTIEGMVAARRLDRSKVDDPWGVPYRITCFGDPLRVRVVSSGPDRRADTVDDVADVTPAAAHDVASSGDRVIEVPR